MKRCAKKINYALKIGGDIFKRLALDEVIFYKEVAQGTSRAMQAARGEEVKKKDPSTFPPLYFTGWSRKSLIELIEEAKQFKENSSNLENKEAKYGFSGARSEPNGINKASWSSDTKINKKNQKLSITTNIKNFFDFIMRLMTMEIIIISLIKKNFLIG